MDYRLLGNSGLKISELYLGAMMFGEKTDPRAARKITESVWDADVNFIDTADAYCRRHVRERGGRIAERGLGGLDRRHQGGIQSAQSRPLRTAAFSAMTSSSTLGQALRIERLDRIPDTPRGRSVRRGAFPVMAKNAAGGMGQFSRAGL